METPKAISNFFLEKSFETGIPLTPMKVLKLVYLAHGWHMGYYENPLINEAVQAWRYGPVVASVYHDFKQYGDSNIDKLATQLEIETDGDWLFKTLTPMVQQSNEKQINILNAVWDAYKDWSGLQLSTLTHEEGSPWDLVWNTRGGKDEKAAIIPNDLIRDYYSDRVRKIRANKKVK
jgi:uncharacterized phage-associated protein